MRPLQVGHGAFGGFKLRPLSIGADRFAEGAGEFLLVGLRARLLATSGEGGDTGELKEATAWIFRHAEILSHFDLAKKMST